MAAVSYVRICPVCDAANAADRQQCACGASLAGVDFSRADVKSGVSLPDVVKEVESVAQFIPCPHPDCAQPNPLDVVLCVYCNRSMQVAADVQPGSRRLPPSLAARYRVQSELRASGSEADLLLVESLAEKTVCVAKLYRAGIEPDSAIFERLSQSAGQHLVRLIEHGDSAGVFYEVMEYCPYGTLRDLLAADPMPRDSLLAVIANIAEALDAIHAARIIHRDLKPENILVRSLQPLDLALTDFGIASLQEATQHFTGGARTVRYAAPEALTGVIDAKADWWALGMIVLEAVLGRHPFEGLNEQVINHQLATRPVDVRDVLDDGVNALCRGLLLRDPARRWGSDEARRWLRGDPSLQAPTDNEAASTVRPYLLGKAECTSAVQLGLALARNWKIGCHDLMKGRLAAWVENELHDHNLTRSLDSIMAERDVSDDRRLLALIHAILPDLPPLWRGIPLSRDTVRIATRQSLAGDEAAASWLNSLAGDNVLKFWGAQGQTDLGQLHEQWQGTWRRFREVWEAAKEAEQKWRSAPKSLDGYAASAVVNFDDVLYSRPLRLSLPRRDSVNALLLSALADPRAAQGWRAELHAAWGEFGQAGEYCPWFSSFDPGNEPDAETLLAAHRLLPFARDDAAVEKQRRSGHGTRQADDVAGWRAAMAASLRAVFVSGREPPASRDEADSLFASLIDLHAMTAKISGQGGVEGAVLGLRKDLDRVTDAAINVQAVLGEQMHVDSINAIWLKPKRIFLCLAILLFLNMGVGIPAVLLIPVGIALTVAIIWRCTLARDARQRTRRALQRLHALIRLFVAEPVA